MSKQPQKPSSVASKGKGKATSSWFTFGQASRAAKEVKTTVLGLIRDIVKLPDTSAAMLLLESCEDACRTHNIAFSAVLQEKSIEGYSPIYWSIIKRASEPHNDDDPDLVSTLLALAEPLSDATISEIRLACLDTSDQTLFQRLRRSPAFAPLSGPDQMLLGMAVAPDDVEVTDVDGDEGAFVAHFRITQFQKRMRVTKHIDLQFIARGRIWEFKFLVLEKNDTIGGRLCQSGSWLINLSLLEHSPPTWIDSRLIIEDSRGGYTSPVTENHSPTTPTSPSAETPSKLRPTISLRLKSGAEQLAPPQSTYQSRREIVASLDDSLMGKSLQYENTSYISSDGSLYARLEAKLMKPGAECIIC
ncbi:hypothetical protein C8Q75DRAFT_722319 [Abortiporus biennis]|nr:hypothetical protein C8Q75DRAFT_722319 [Abortiporus biennis]